MTTSRPVPTGAAVGVVVGVDGSPSSEQALRWAAAQARLTGRELRAVGSWEYPVTYGVAGLDAYDWRGSTAATLAKTVADALSPDDAARVVQVVAEGHPAQALLDQSDGADLLVVGCRGRGGFTGMLMGSVSQAVVTHASCPVVVVHGGSVPNPART
jgi:nucleotide-binding universal stress UspA family protein